jgi:integrase
MASGFAYVLGWTDATGPKRKQFASEAEAEAEGRLKADQLAAGRIEGAEMGRSDRDELQAARKLVGDVPLLTALEEWAKIRTLTNGHALAAAEAWSARNSTTFERISVKAAVADFLAAKKRAGVDVAASYKKILPTLAAKFDARLIDTLSAKELEAWMHERYPHPVTFNTARKRFVSLWRWCRKQGHLPRDSQTEAEQTESAREPDTAIGVISAETFGKLLEHFRAKHPEYLAALIIAGFTGLRRSEIHEQTWENISLERKILRVTNAKRNTPARRLVPLSDAAIEWLMLCPDRKGEICTNFAIDRIRDIGRTAGFKLPENCFRHSCISHRVAQIGNVAETALESGNSPTIIFRNYRELFDKTEGEAWFSIRPSTTAGKVVAYA